MFAPPPGYEDMLSDAAAASRPIPDYRDLFVNAEVGTVQAVKPLPPSLPLIAAAARPDVPDRERVDSMIRFAQSHLAEGEFERLLFEQLLDRMPVNVMERVTEALCCWGTARPYTAVVTLAVHTAHQWRDLRAKLLLAGIPDPMQLPTMHVLLDLTETLTLENMAKLEKGAAKMAEFQRLLYQPTAKAVPPGFSPDEIESDFDAFVKAARK